MSDAYEREAAKAAIHTLQRQLAEVTKLRQAGYAVSVPHPDGIRGANNKLLPMYLLTPEGERVIAKLRDELTKISERIKRKANA